jgi:hypothetical protein
VTPLPDVFTSDQSFLVKEIEVFEIDGNFSRDGNEISATGDVLCVAAYSNARLLISPVMLMMHTDSDNDDEGNAKCDDRESHLEADGKEDNAEEGGDEYGIEEHIKFGDETALPSDFEKYAMMS